MTGVLRPTEGSVLIDGNDLEEFDPVSVRGQIAYLPQHGEIFNGTILENISMFRPEREEAALETAKRLGLDSIIARMPMGYDSKVGEGAHEALARGIKQRIAIACALVDRPRILLFDEANTALDSKSDNILHAVLENLKGHCTLVLVTHRPSLLKLSDRRFHIEDGYLTEPEKDAPQLIPPPAKEVSA
jgi:ATP-binding cassette subfamily C protein LapB